MVVHRSNVRRIGRIVALAGASMVLAAVFSGAQSAERNTDARIDANSRNTGTTPLRTEERHEKKKKQAVTPPKKKNPANPN